MIGVLDIISDKIKRENGLRKPDAILAELTTNRLHPLQRDKYPCLPKRWVSWIWDEIASGGGALGECRVLSFGHCFQIHSDLESDLF